MEISLKERCDQKVLLTDPILVFNNPQLKPKSIPATKIQGESNKIFARDTVAVRKVAECIDGRRKKEPTHFILRQLIA